jgi:cation transport regulator ChaB
VPYATIRSLPSGTKKLSLRQKHIFRATFNSALSKYGEESAFKIAYAAAKKYKGKPKVKVKGKR